MTPEEWAKQFAEDWGMTMETMRDLEARIVAVIEQERQRTTPLLDALQAHFNRHGAASDPELAEAFAQYCQET